MDVKISVVSAIIKIVIPKVRGTKFMVRLMLSEDIVRRVILVIMVG